MAGEAEHESGSGAIAWAAAGLNVSNIFMRAAKTLGRTLSPVFVRAGAHLGNAASVGAVAYTVYREQGLTHKGERAAADLAATGLNIGLGGAAATAGETAALTGVAGATGATVVTAAAPVALSVVAAGATAKMADLAIENRRAYEALDRDTARDAAPQKIRKRVEGEKPSIIDYKHLAGMREVTAHMRDEALRTTVPIERFAGSGAVKNLRAIDLTEPQNLAEYERALNTEIEQQLAVMMANDSALPRWMRHGDSVNRYNFADGELQNLLGAKEELAMFRQDVQRYNERLSRDAAGIASPSAAGHDGVPATKGKMAPGFNEAVAGTQPEHHPEPRGVAPAARSVKSVTPA
jgi:hypothetical protein